MAEKKLVYVVKPEPYRWVGQESYETLLSCYLDHLNDHKEEVSYEIIDDFGNVEKKLKEKLPDSLVFISAQRSGVVERIAAKFPKVRVVILTGELPKGKVIFFHKLWMTEKMSLAKIITTD